MDLGALPDGALPDLDRLDKEALKALVLAHWTEIATLEAELEDQRKILSEQGRELLSRSEQIEHLKLTIEKLRRAMFGRKSEKIVVQLEQLELHLEELESAQAEMEAVIEAVSPAAEVKPRSPRKPLPEHLPREVVTHLPQGDCCSSCGGMLRQFGEDVAEQLEYVPESFKVIRHVRPKFACNSCDRVVEAPAPSRPIERGLDGPGLLAHVLVSKFADHLPLYRQSEIYARQGVEIERSTLAGWVGAASELLTPLLGALQKHVLGGSKLHADDTPIPVLAPGKGKTKTGRLWTYVRDDRPAEGWDRFSDSSAVVDAVGRHRLAQAAEDLDAGGRGISDKRDSPVFMRLLWMISLEVDGILGLWIPVPCQISIGSMWML